jgi:hypothetical protein
LSDELRQAQQSLVAGGREEGTNGTEAALDNVERLRRQIEALTGQNRNGAGGQNYQPGSLSRNGQPAPDGQSAQPREQGQPGQQGGQNAQGGQRGDRNAAIGGDTQPGGGGRTGTLYGNVDTGNNARPGAPRSAPAQQTPSVDPQQAIQQGLSELTQLRREVANDPEMQKQIQELISEMEHLDLRRFPGNPAMVEELHQRILSGVDTLELQLRRAAEDKSRGQIHSADSLTVPPGYKDAVADYFRRLSTTRPSTDRDKQP